MNFQYRKVSMGKKLGFCLLLAGMGLFTVCRLFQGAFEDFAFEQLEFPFQNPEHIERMAAFGIPGWSGSEPHNGIDLIIYDSLDRTRIISPHRGTVQSIEASENPFSHPAGQLLLKINIFINDTWTISLVIEPGTTRTDTKADQRDAVLVEEGEEVRRGQGIADLLTGEHGYAHLHYMVLMDDEPVCAYHWSTLSARREFETILRTRSGNYLPDGNICYGED